jgi:[ribosomal protein S18]-alanine N-acetyltransferase
MHVRHLDVVMAIETRAYAFPWSRGNFAGSLAAGHPAWVLHNTTGEMLGYMVAMQGVDEMHLLNITVAFDEQGRGHARYLMNALIDHCRAVQAHQLWLEVRISNTHARSIYQHCGFVEISVRKGYYPAAQQQREDATVMSLLIRSLAAPERLHHALD